MPVHQNHDYSHHPQGQMGVWYGSEAERNRELIAAYRHFVNLSDATHRLTSKHLELNLRMDRFMRMV